MNIDLSIPHQVIHGDCLEVLKSLPDGCVDAVVTDPPYGIDIGGAKAIGGAGVVEPTEYGKHDWDKQGLSAEQWAECVRVSRSQVGWGFNHLSDVYGPCASMLVWDKKCQNGWNDSFSDHESAFCSNGKAAMFRMLWVGALRNRSGGNEKRFHPTQKPVQLMGWCLDRAGVHVGATVLDPFCGSGTTGVACVQTGRRFIGIEIEEKYVKIARRRIADAAPLFVREKEPEPMLIGEPK